MRLRRRLEQLAAFGRPPQGTFDSGVSRVAYSNADISARAWLLGEMRGAGLEPRIDAAGNIFARWGPENAQPPILFGSHIDSVPSGGNFDGDLGSLAALEVMQACQAAGVTSRRPFEMVVWAHEESTAFGRGTAASRIVAGVPIGIVEGIVAIHRYDVDVIGFANHAGTTPMDERQDALQAASMLVLAVREMVTTREGRQVGTVGQLEVEPNSPNVVPGRVRLSVEFRDLSEATLIALGEDLRARANRIARESRTTITATLATKNPAAPAHSGVQAVIEHAAEAAGLAARRLPSGAGHDAQMIAALCPMGMIFVPSIGGISHSPKERTGWDDCARGAAVLLGAVLALDQSAEV